MISADLSGIGNYIGAVDGLITALEDPRVQGDFIGNIMDHARKTFYVESTAAMISGAANIKHVYEWGEEQGEVSNVRLYTLTKHGRDDNRFMSFHFLPSTQNVPLPDPTRYGFPAASKRGNTLSRHVFTMKALVMETKSSVIIKPVRAKSLFIPVEGHKKGFVMAPSARVNPGGKQATGGFAKWWTQWFETRAPAIAIEESKKAEETIAATGQKVIRYAAGTRIGGRAVGGQFASARGVSYGYINAKKQAAEMQARNMFKKVWDEEEDIEE